MSIKAVICGESSSATLDPDNLFFLKLNTENINEIIPSPYVIINTDSIYLIERILRLIRQHSIPQLYLKPVFLMVKSELRLDKYFEMAVDKAMPLAKYQESKEFFADAAESINKSIRTIPSYDTILDNNLSLKTLRYSFTRDSQLIPLRSSRTPLGYSYPPVDFFFGLLDKKLYSMLDFLESHNLIDGTPADIIFSCVKCRSAFINSREVCPKCKSFDIAANELIHHFRCAYVGPLSDFEKGDNLICPKCSKQLRMLGSDYEKPSAMNSCQSCGASFQEPEIRTECFHCGQQNPPQDLIKRTVKKYLLSSLSTSIVIHGMGSILQHVAEENLKLIKFFEFQKFLEIEIQRIKRYKQFTDTLCLISIKNLKDIYIALGDKYNKFFEELSSIMSDIFRTSDIITSYNDSTFIVLMCNTPSDSAEGCRSRLKENFSNLIKHNMDYEPEMHIEFIQVDGTLNSNDLIREIVKNAFD